MTEIVARRVANENTGLTRNFEKSSLELPHVSLGFGEKSRTGQQLTVQRV